jgi:afadin
VLAVLAGAMALLRRCRVNAALTIQLFSQLFHFVNMWAFNRMVCGDARLCTRQWGLRLKARLGHIEEWAEKQGLELAADCHLSRIIQAAHLLQVKQLHLALI